MKRVATAVGLAALVATLGSSGRASACSCAEPTANSLQLGGGRIPANAGGIVWWFAPGYLRDPEGPLAEFGLDVQADLEQLQAMVRLQRQLGAELRDVAVRVEPLGPDTYLIRPEQAWSAGESYQLSVDAGQGYGDPETRMRVRTFEVVPALARPRGALPLQHSELQRGPLPFLVTDGSCGTSRDSVYLDVEFPAPDGLAEWPAELLFYTTYVDDEPWSHSTSLCATTVPGASWVSRSGNRLLAACDRSADEGRPPSGFGFSELGLSEGGHRVRMQAQLPGTELVYSTQTLDIDLRCGNDAVVTLAAQPQQVAAATEDDPPGAAGCSLSGRARARSSAAGAYGLAGLALALARRRAQGKPQRRRSA